MFNFFKKAVKNIHQIIPKVIEGENEIYFHEDLFCQVEFIPRENIFHLEKENEAINEFSREHSDEMGYSGIYVREENPISISERNIDVNNLDALLLDLGFAKADTVYYGYASEKIKCSNTNAYRLKNSDIFFEYKNQIVTAFWISGFRFRKDELVKSNLKSILSAIGSEYNVVLNDWDLSVTIDLSKETEIEKYLNEGF